MTTRISHKIIPSSKLTADNTGNLELPSHRKAVASASAALTAASPTPLSPSSLTTACPLTPPQIDDAPRARPLAKCSSQASLSVDSVIDISPTTVKGSLLTVDAPRARPLPKRSSQAMSSTISVDSVIDISPTTSDDASDSAPKAKKVKVSASSDQQVNLMVLPDGATIIEIDDIEVDVKVDKTANIKKIFKPALPQAGQAKKHMQCDVCK
jgi:hypothetical protein